MYENGEISMFLRNDIDYSKEDIDRWASMLTPDKIQFPEGFLLLGSLVGVALSDRYTDGQNRFASQAVCKLPSLWKAYKPPPMSDQTSPSTYKDNLYNQFVTQVYTMAGIVHMHYGNLYFEPDTQFSNLNKAEDEK